MSKNWRCWRCPKMQLLNFFFTGNPKSHKKSTDWFAVDFERRDERAEMFWMTFLGVADFSNGGLKSCLSEEALKCGRNMNYGCRCRIPPQKKLPVQSTLYHFLFLMTCLFKNVPSFGQKCPDLKELSNQHVFPQINVLQVRFDPTTGGEMTREEPTGEQVWMTIKRPSARFKKIDALCWESEWREPCRYFL